MQDPVGLEVAVLLIFEDLLGVSFVEFLNGWIVLVAVLAVNIAELDLFLFWHKKRLKRE